jgi:hypothetical protein
VYAELAGDLCSGMLLSQLAYWWRPSRDGGTKLRVERGGKLWLAKSRADMMRDCGLTEWQLRRSLERLRSLGLVEQEVHLFQNRTTLHLHLRVDVLEGLLRERACAVQECIDERTAQDRSGGTLKTSAEESSRPYDAEITAEPIAEVAGEPAEDGGGGTRRERVATSREILRRMRERREQVGTRATVPAMALLWKRRVGVMYGEFTKDLTRQELGQLKLLLAKLGEGAPRALDLVLTNWGRFAFEARARYGLKVVPERPVVGFVLKYHDIAVQLVAGSPGPPLAAKWPDAVEVAPTPAVPADDYASEEDVKAALASLKKGGAP